MPREACADDRISLRLAEMGIKGALVASALHDGRLGASEIAEFGRLMAAAVGPFELPSGRSKTSLDATLRVRR